MEKRDLQTGLVKERKTTDTLKRIGMCFLSLASTAICAEWKDNQFKARKNTSFRILTLKRRKLWSGFTSACSAKFQLKILLANRLWLA